MIEDDASFIGGCIAGIAVALLALLIFHFTNLEADDMAMRKVEELSEKVAELEQTVGEDREIMRTYRFFNETWKAILEKDKEDNE